MGYAVMDVDINKITGLRPANTSPSAAKNSTGSSSSGTAAGSNAANASGVSVKLTDAATALFQSTQDVLQQEPDVDQAKVAELRNAVDSGGYRVDSSRVAAKIVKMEPDF